MDVTSYLTYITCHIDKTKPSEKQELRDVCGCNVAFSSIDSVTLLLQHLPASCSFRYEDAVSKYEAVMKTEPNVHPFSLLAKERICHALAEVRPLTAAMRCIKSLFYFIKQYIQAVRFLCVVTRASRLAELSRCVAKSSSRPPRTLTCLRTELRPTSKRNSMRKVSLSDVAVCVKIDFFFRLTVC